MTNLDGSIVLGGLDAIVPNKDGSDVLRQVEDIVEHSVEQNNPAILEKLLTELKKINQITGLAFAKFIYHASYAWDKFGRRDSFTEWMEDKFGVTETTVKRNFRVWDMIVSGDVPTEYAEQMKTMPIRNLIPISTAWGAEKYEFSSHDWKKLVDAPDQATINKILHEIKGTEPRSNAITYSWSLQDKRLIIWNQNKPHPVNMMFDETDETILNGLARLFGDKVMEK